MDKWTQETWLEATLAEAYQESEDVTLPAAEGLVRQSKILSERGDGTILQVLDNGVGMGQVTDSLFSMSSGDLRSVRITCGDIDDGLLEIIEMKKIKNGWNNVSVMKLDATHMINIADQTYDHIFGNFLYFLVQDPMAALNESFRALKPGGTLSFTTWSLSGPYALLQLAQAQLEDYPLASPNPRLLGSWNHPRYVRSQLEQVGFTEIIVTPFAFSQKAASATEMAKKMRHVIMLHTLDWGKERRDKGWQLGEMITKTLRQQQGDGQVTINSVVLLISAKRPIS